MNPTVLNIIGRLRSVRIKRNYLTFDRTGKVLAGIFFLLVFLSEANGQNETSTTLTASPNPSCLNQPVVLTASVNEATATGTVRFYDGITVLGDATLSGGQASISISTLSLGVHNALTATYFGEAPFNGSTSNPISLTINAPPSINSQPDPQTAGVGCTTSFSVTATGTAPFTYQWRKNGVEIPGAISGTFSITGIATSDAGNYDVEITNSCGTVTSNAALLTVNDPLSVIPTSLTHVLCFGASTGAIDITAAGGVGPYTYAWTGPGVNATAEDQTGLAAGNYSVTISDQNGCSPASLNVTITQPASAVSVTLTGQTNILCFGASTGAINITPSGGVGPYSYAWSGADVNATAEDQTGLAAGNYSVIVTDANGCSSASLPVTITQPASAVSVSLTSQTNVLCFGALTGAINITASGGVGPYTYAWTGTGVNATAQDQAGLTAGNYSVIVTDANGCSSASLPVTITQPSSAISVSLTGQTNILCFGASSGTINITPSGGVGPYSYAWTGAGVNATAEDQTGLTAGNYSVIVTDANGCSAASLPVTILQPPSAISITNISSNTPVCEGNTLNLSATANGGTGTLTYSWAGPAGFTSNQQNPSIPNLTTAATGTYTVTVTDANGCSANATTSVTVTALPDAIIDYIGSPFCRSLATAQAVTLTGTGAYTGGTFSATPAGLTINPSTGAITPSTSTAGIYTVTYIIPAAGGCSSVNETTSVTITAVPTATITYAGTPFCTSVSSAQPVTLTGTGAYTAGTFSAAPAGLIIDPSTGAITPGTSTPGTYTVTYLIPASNGCAAVPVTTAVTITLAPSAAISYANINFCRSVTAAQTVTLTGTGAYTGGTFSAVPAGLTINATSGAITPSSSTAGTYTITYSRAASGGCAAISATTSVTITAVPTATITYAGTPYCTSVSTAQPVTLTGTGAYTGGTFSAAPAGLTIDPSTGAITPGTSTPGTYTVTYTIPASGGCVAVPVTTSVTVTLAPTASINYADIAFCRSVSAAQTVTLTGTGAYTGGTFTAAPAGLSINATSGAITPSTSTAGTYTITYTRAASGGCAAITATTSINITAVPTATINYAGTPFCTSVITAQPVTLTGTGAYTGGTFTASPAGLNIDPSSGAITPGTSTAGTYTVTYTIPASGGCTAISVTRSITITLAPTVSISYTGAPFCRSVTAAQTVTLTGTGAYTGGTYTAAPAGLTINATSGAITPSTSTAGTYTITYTRAASGGCAAISATTSVTITAVPTATITYAGTPYCTSVSTAQPVTLTGTGAYTGGTFTAAPAGLTIDPSTGAVTPGTSTPGTYTVTYTIPASGGCAAIPVTRSITITLAPTASINYADIAFCRSVTAAQTVTLSGTGAYTGGTFTAAPAGLSINATSGAITPSTSTAGTYTITYTRAASGGCAAITATTSINITAVPTATINYAGTPFCTSVITAQPVTLTGTGAYTGGTFTASPAGLTIDPSSGAITPGTSTAGTYTVTYTIPASGGCAAIPVTRSITITLAPTVSINYAGIAFCRSVTTAQPVTLSGTGTYTGGTFSATPAGLNINASTGAIIPSSSTAGSYTITYTRAASGGCAAISATTSIAISAVPTIANAGPDQTGIATCGLTSVTLAANTPANGTGTWSIVSGTGGTITTPGSPTSTFNGISGNTYTLRWTISNPPCAPSTNDVIITLRALPNIIVPTPPAMCSGNSVTLTASGANTYTWSPATGLSITTGPTVIATPEVTTTYTVTGTNTTTGCTNSINITVTVIPGPKGDMSSEPPVCYGNNIGTVNLSNYTGTILGWESSIDAGTTWTTISGTTNNGTTSVPFSNLTQTTIYRALLELNGCQGYSSIGIIPVSPLFVPTATATPPVICLGQSAQLAASGYGQPPLTLEDFVNANPAGWSGNDANNNNQDDNTDWGESGCDKTFNGITFCSNAPPNNGATTNKYMIVAGTTDGADHIASLITPPFSLVGTINPTFNYWTALNFSVGTTGTVDISIDGGTTWTTLRTYTGPTNVGNAYNGWTQNSINVSAYIGQPNVMVRFHYNGTAGSNWGVDNVGIAATFQPVTYQWSPTTYLTPTNGQGQTVTTTPTTPGTFTYCVVATSAVGCSSPCVPVDVTVNPLPTCDITGPATVCPQSTNVYSGPAIAGYTYNWTVTGGATISGSSTGQTVTVIANNSCGTYTVRLITTLNGCASIPCTFTVNVVDNIAPVAPAAPAPLSFQCLTDVPAPGVLTASDNCAGTLNATGVDVQVAAGCGYTITRTWTFTDACNNTSSVSQTINVLDNTPPVAPPAPATLSFQCLTDVPAAGTLTATDNCSGAITATGVDVQVAAGCGYTITRTWTFTDACNNTSSVSQIINVLDNTAPVAPAAPAAQNFQCLTEVPAPGTLTATDNCSNNITVTGVDVQVANGCGYTITRTWTFTDDCNNTTSVSQSINVLDDIPPVITCAPAQAFCVVNSNTYTIPLLTASDNCSNSLTITYEITGATTRSGTGNNASGIFNMGVSIITWTVTDECGNDSTCTTSVSISPKPTPIIYHN